MNAKDISSRKFDRGFNGYKLDDVDAFLGEVASEFSHLQKEKKDLEKKLEVLADKVREYRDDEDALKEALLGAQKTGHAAIAEAKKKAQKIVEDAEEKAKSMLTVAEEKSKKLKTESEEILKNANDEAKKMHNEATAKHTKMEEEYKNRLDLNKEILYKTKNEVTRFRQKLLEDFTRVTGIIDALPESCENEFISKTLSDYQKERNVTLKKPAVVKSESAPAIAEKDEKSANGKKKILQENKPLSNLNLNDDKIDLLEKTAEDESDALYEEFAAQMAAEKKSTTFELELTEGTLADLTTEINFEPVFEEDPNDAKDEKQDDAESLIKKTNETVKDSDIPLFKKKIERNDRDMLEFGKKTANVNKK